MISSVNVLELVVLHPFVNQMKFIVQKSGGSLGCRNACCLPHVVAQGLLNLFKVACRREFVRPLNFAAHTSEY